MISQLSKFFFGYDVFISYAYKDGKQYARTLAEQLSNLDLACFLDEEELPFGGALTLSLKRAIRRSKVFLLVGTTGSVESHYVELELKEAMSLGRPVIPVDIDGIRGGLSELKQLPWINESHQGGGAPSAATLEGIRRHFRFRRRNAIARSLVSVAALVLLVVAVVAVLQRNEAVAQREEAERQRNVATARQLASDSELLRNSVGGWTSAGLLAVESLRRAETPQGYEALWRVDAGTRREVARLAHQYDVWAVVFSPDGTLVATGSLDITARVFEARTGREVARLAHPESVFAVAFSPDGTLVATGSEDSTAWVFEARTGRGVARLAHQGLVSAVAFSPDGRLVVTGSLDKTGRVFEARTGRKVAWLAHQGQVVAVAFSPDGTLVATGSDDRTARVFDARTGREVARLPMGGRVVRVDFVDGGRFLRTVTGEWDLRIERDPIRAQDLIADACSKLDRNLTPEEWKQYLGDLPYRKTCEHLNPATAARQQR